MNLRQWTKKLITGMQYDMSLLKQPALLFDQEGGLLDYSESALPLVQAFHAGESTLKAFLDTIDELHPVAEDRLVISQMPLVVYWLAGVRIDECRILLVGRNVSNDEKLLQAFVSSRALFGDLLRCAVDFGWESDETGAIVYIGPDKGLGWSGLDVVGEDAWHLFCPKSESAGKVNPFVAREPQEIKNIIMTSRTGESHRMTVSSIPKFDDHGHWVGSRGVCRDVNEEFNATISARQLSARNAIFSRVIAAMRTEIGAEALLEATAKAVAEVLRADASWVMRPDNEAPLYTGIKEMEDYGDEVMDACLGSEDWRLQKEGRRIIEIAGRAMQMLTIVGEQGLDGVIIVSRDTTQFPWRDYEGDLLQDVFEHLGLALRQAALFERMEHLSTVDELTGLYNRRAFTDLVNKRIAAQRRNRSSGCLLYIDLDYFKEVNDTLGHAAGDAVLTVLGQKLNNAIRAEDIPGRLGGDEFALWLEATPVEGAKVKAKEFIAMAAELRRAAGDEKLRLSMSIGIARAEPDDKVTLEKLAATADEALYQAKKSGRGKVVVA